MHEFQRALQETLDGPLRAIAENQERVRNALDGPLAQIREHQDALARAMEGPFAALVRNQDLIRAVMNAAAVAAANDEIEGLVGGDEEQSRWLREWSAAIGEWAPTWEQVEVFLSALSLLLAVILYAATKTDTVLPEELLTQLGILCAAGALLISRVRRRRGD